VDLISRHAYSRFLAGTAFSAAPYPLHPGVDRIIDEPFFTEKAAVQKGKRPGRNNPKNETKN
jgi:hypothetical protein